MNNIYKIRIIVAAIVAVCLLNVTAFALSEVVTFESKVISNSVSGSTDSTTYVVTGPGNVHYRIEAAPVEIQRIQTFVKTNPDAVIRFNGTVDELGGTKVFRVNNWEQSTHTSKTTETDSLGNTRVIEKTETHSTH